MTTKAKIAYVIPARLNSTRLHEKMLIEINNVPVFVHTARRLMDWGVPANDIYVLTDSKRIVDAGDKHGVKALDIGPAANGTHRVGVAMRCIDTDKYTHFINVQGDEPLISNEQLKTFSEWVAVNGTGVVTTMSAPLSKDALLDPNVVKVITDSCGKAVWFTRSEIQNKADSSKELPVNRHVGIYGYARELLDDYRAQGVSILEEMESLEQMRWFEMGKDIYVKKYEGKIHPGLDTPQQLVYVTQALLAAAEDIEIRAREFKVAEVEAKS